jgi:hypothetical protein
MIEDASKCAKDHDYYQCSVLHRWFPFMPGCTRDKSEDGGTNSAGRIRWNHGPNDVDCYRG